MHLCVFTHVLLLQRVKCRGQQLQQLTVERRPEGNGQAPGLGQAARHWLSTGKALQGGYQSLVGQLRIAGAHGSAWRPRTKPSP
jgi:hypothetical protein